MNLHWWFKLKILWFCFNPISAWTSKMVYCLNIFKYTIKILFVEPYTSYTVFSLWPKLNKIVMSPWLEADHKMYEYKKREFINVCTCVVQLVHYVQPQSNVGLITNFFSWGHKLNTVPLPIVYFNGIQFLCQNFSITFKNGCLKDSKTKTKLSKYPIRGVGGCVNRWSNYT